MTTPERRPWHRSDVSIVKFELISCCSGVSVAVLIKYTPTGM